MSWRGQISKKVQEIRLIACQLSESSRGMRQFFHENYNELHMLNPSMPLMYRESELIDPFIYARYDWGKEQKIYVTDKTPEEITQILQELVEFGDTVPKSPESDVWVPAPVIRHDQTSQDVEALNLSWNESQPIRRNPEWELSAEDLKMIEEEDLDVTLAKRAAVVE